jgi:hypothetical protein
VVIAATLDNVRDGLAVDLKVYGKVPAEIRHSNHTDTAIWFNAVCYRECREKIKSEEVC